jgi:hypothetical protein
MICDKEAWKRFFQSVRFKDNAPKCEHPLGTKNVKFPMQKSLPFHKFVVCRFVFTCHLNRKKLNFIRHRFSSFQVLRTILRERLDFVMARTLLVFET